MELAGLGVEGDVDLAEILKMAEHADDCRPVALRNTHKVINLLHHRKSVDPVRIGLFLLADEGGVPSAEVLDLLICVKKIWSVVRHSFQIDTSCQKIELVQVGVVYQISGYTSDLLTVNILSAPPGTNKTELKIH